MGKVIERVPGNEWSEWTDIEKNASYDKWGVYKIRLVDSKRGSPIEICRFLGKDKDGILQISISKGIKTRIKYFRGAAEGKGHVHAEGRRLYLIKKYTNFMKRYTNCKTQYSFKKLSAQSKVKQEKKRLLKCYFKKHGEVPPLNNNLPDKDVGWESLICD